MEIVDGVLDGILEALYNFVIWLVTMVYALVSNVYQIFLVLAENNIFEQDIFKNIADKIYVILGVVMLFIVAYNLLTLVIDPDKNSKGGSVEKILKSLVTSFILIIICPSLFNFAFRVQNSILTTNGGVVNNLFADDLHGRSGEDTIKAGGKIMAIDTFKAFFTPTDGNYNVKNKSVDKEYTLNDGTKINCKAKNSCTLSQAEKVAYDTGKFEPYHAFAMNIVEGDINFNWLVGLIAGGYLLYIIVSFCFDLAVRACKLGLYQIIAPICISCRMLPNKESIFTNWLKAVKNTFLSLFVRIFIMNLGVLILSSFDLNNIWNNCQDCDLLVTVIGNAFIILGIMTFVQKAPKLVDEIFNFGDIKIGIMDKVKQSGVMTVGAALGGGISAGALAYSKHRQEMKKIDQDASKSGTEKKGYKRQQRLRGWSSVLASTVSGTARGASHGANAGNFRDMQNAAGQAAEETAAARGRRQERNERYQATQTQGKVVVDGVINVGNVFKGRIADIKADFHDWATGGATPYEGIIKVADQFKQAQDKIHSEAEKLINKHKNNANYVAKMTEFKGDDAGNLKRYYDEYRAAGASLGAIESDINRLKNVNNVDEMAKILGIATTDPQYSQVGALFAQMLADRDSMYNQLWKQSRLDLEERVLKSKNYTAAQWDNEKILYGVSQKDYDPIYANEEEFRVLHESHGGRYTDPDTGEIKIVAANTAKNIDDIATARQVEGARARSQSARIRQQAEVRKSQSGHGNGNGH